MENDRITSHKLIFHPDRVVNWLKTGEEYPINAEIAISGACNHRCVFCTVDYMKYEPFFLSRDLINNRLQEMHEKGLKSVLLAGNGEPLMHRDAVELINDIKDIGIDVALSTNGVLFTRDKAEACMKSLSWIRFSVSAGTEENYKKIHRGKEGDLARLFKNIQDAEEIKQRQGLDTVLNVQIVMTPDNVDEVVLLARKVKELGADRFIVKSLGWLPRTESELRKTIDRKEFYENQNGIQEELAKLNDSNFICVYRSDRVNKIAKEKNYRECLASVFHVCIDSKGDVFPCCTFMGVPEMSYGNINALSFNDIWMGKQRKEVLNKLKISKLKECPSECKLDNMNCYLNELINPGAHVNFI
jgi:radical SAM protein with 4Fe4S-binding SPASM domain